MQTGELDRCIHYLDNLADQTNRSKTKNGKLAQRQCLIIGWLSGERKTKWTRGDTDDPLTRKWNTNHRHRSSGWTAAEGDRYIDKLVKGNARGSYHGNNYGRKNTVNSFDPRVTVTATVYEYLINEYRWGKTKIFINDLWCQSKLTKHTLYINESICIMICVLNNTIRLFSSSLSLFSCLLKSFRATFSTIIISVYIPLHNDSVTNRVVRWTRVELHKNSSIKN